MLFSQQMQHLDVAEILIIVKHYGECHQNRVQGRAGFIHGQGHEMQSTIFFIGFNLFQIKIDQRLK
jgi:hypothetical protein